jgi:hypothetical protein
MGLVTASLSMARSIYVLTREEGATAWQADFDLDRIAEEDKFVISLQPASSERVLRTLGKRGTVVRLTKVDRMGDRNISRFAQTLRDKLGRVYRNHLERGTKIKVNNRLVHASDPLMRGHELTEVVLDQEVRVGNGSARLVVVELPDLGTQGDAEAGIAPHRSGFYVVRNGREIMSAQTFGFYRHHHSYSHFRAELSFGGSLDHEFHVDVKKASIHPSDKLLDKLRRPTERLIAASGRRGRDRVDTDAVRLNHDLAAGRINATPAPTKGPVPLIRFDEADLDDDRLFRYDGEEGSTQITYNARHPFLRMIHDQRDRRVSAVLDYISYALASSVRKHPEGEKVLATLFDELKELAEREAA